MKFAKKTDIIIVISLAVIGVVCWLLFTVVFAKSGTVAEIYYQTELVKTIELTTGKEETFTIEQVPEVVFHLYEDGSIAFIESDCPDKICIQSGRLHLIGQFAACLPNQLYMKIVSHGPAQTDAPDIIIG